MQDQQSEDIILLNGYVLTIDNHFSIQQAVAIRGSHIQAVGYNEEIRALARSYSKIIDLQGHTVIPGIIDTHAHMDREGLKNMQPTLAGVQSISDILAIIKQEVALKKPGEWVVTMPIGNPPNYMGVLETLTERRYPTRYELDSVSLENPVYIRGIWGPWNVPPSISIANSRALQLAGIDRHTQSPHRSVIIDHDVSGEPTGVIIDNNIFPVTEFTLMRVVPRFTHNERVGHCECQCNCTTVWELQLFTKVTK